MNAIIGNKLKNLRKKKSWSQEQVADYLKLSQSAYARMESGESHSWSSHIDKICEIFEITPEELVKSDNLIIGNIGTNNGVGYAEIINQLSEKLIEQYEKRILEKEEIIRELKLTIEKIKK
jgi:transcriptional regulator with XRE-family HTH domain